MQISKDEYQVLPRYWHYWRQDIVGNALFLMWTANIFFVRFVPRAKSVTNHWNIFFVCVCVCGGVCVFVCVCVEFVESGYFSGTLIWCQRERGKAIREHVVKVCFVRFKFGSVGQIEAWMKHCTALKNNS